MSTSRSTRRFASGVTAGAVLLGCSAFGGGESPADPTPLPDGGAVSGPESGAPDAEMPAVGTPSVFASGQDDVTSLATDGNHLAWTARTGAAVRSCALAGPCTEPVTIAAGGRPNAIVYGTRFLWTDATASKVFFLDDAKKIGSIEVNFFPNSLCTDGVTVYLARNRLTKLVYDPPASDTSVNTVDDPRACAATTSTIVWTTADAVQRCRVEACDAVDLVAAGDKPTALAMDESQIVWTTEDGRLRAQDVKGGALNDLARDLPAPSAVAVDPIGPYVYVAAGGTSAKSYLDGYVARVPRGGGTPTVLAAGQAKPGAILVTKDAVFWANALDSTIRRVAK